MEAGYFGMLLQTQFVNGFDEIWREMERDVVVE